MQPVVQVFVRRSPPLVGSAVEAFSFLAVMTSFIGTSVSLSATLRTEVPPLVHEAARRLGILEGSRRNPAQGTLQPPQAGARQELASSAAVMEAEGVLLGVEGGAATAGAGGEEGGGRGPGPRDRPGLALLLTLGPPLGFTLCQPDAFLGALEVGTEAVGRVV